MEARSHKHKLLNQWLHFGGHVELNESPWKAVCREIREESGYAMDQLLLLQSSERFVSVSSEPLPATVSSFLFGESGQHYHTDLSYAFVTSELPRFPLGDGESGELMRMTVAELQAIKEGDIPENMRAGLLYVVQQLFPKYERITCPETA
jgi:8-oxo-dGTP pyrophosphatase MutT (NUDIX family)